MNTSDYTNTDYVTREKKTEENYTKRAIQLENRAKKDLSIDKIDSRQLVMWLIDNRDKFSKNTYRVYKSSILYYLTSVINTKESLDSANFLVKVSSEKSYSKSTKTSAKKMKRINEDDLILLIEKLDEDNNKWNQYIKTWLISTILCGLRPIEWKDAMIIYENDDIALSVLNAKNTNGRANGDYRTIILNQLDEYELSIIKLQLYNINKFNKLNLYDKFYNNCITQLNKINKLTFGKRKKNITLYSARHQFSANAKFSGKSTSEVAALMGHSVDTTAMFHYGKKQFGNSIINVSPLKSQVNTIKIKSKNFNSTFNKFNKNIKK